VAQNALSGHSIPVSASAMALLVVLGAVSESDAARQRIPGLERAIAKNKGVEFGSLLHQLAVDFAANPQAAKVKQVVGEIVPEARERLPKKMAEPAPQKRVERRPKPKAEAKPAKVEPGESGKESKPDSSKARPAPAVESKSKSPSSRITRKKPK
jgi:endonuclease-3